MSFLLQIEEYILECPHTNLDSFLGINIYRFCKFFRATFLASFNFFGFSPSVSYEIKRSLIFMLLEKNLML